MTWVKADRQYLIVNPRSMQGLEPAGEGEDESQLLEEQTVPLLDGAEGAYRSGRSMGERRTIVIVLATILLGAMVTILAQAFVESSWWYSYSTDQALDRAARAQLEAIRDRSVALGTMPEVKGLLDAALDPETHPTDVRILLITAQQALKASDEAEASRLAEDLQRIIGTMGVIKATVTVSPMPTLSGPDIEQN